jgi:uncharacterized protein (DUF362 family)/ferredoxin
MVKVALIYCDSYDEEQVYHAVKKGIHLIGGLESICRPSEQLVLKPNMLAADPPEKCSTTHPSIFKAVGRCFIEYGVQLTYGDSPAFHKPLTAAKKNGLHEAATSLNIPLADFENGEDIFFEAGSQNKKFFIAKGILESDGVVSLPKLKTHGLARMTGSIKNQFGCVPGKLKGEMHVKLPDAVDFSRMLVDLNHYIDPRLYVMDGILAMEGNGPRGGVPKAMNVILVSTDPVALDATVCRMVHLNPEFVETTKIGMEVGHGTYKEADIHLVGDPLEKFLQTDFDVVRRPIDRVNTGNMQKVLNQLFVPKPYIVEEKCVKCGVCVTMCPVTDKAINWKHDDKNKPPVYNYGKCIRCYCCQELCPESAILVKTPFLRKLID